MTPTEILAKKHCDLTTVRARLIEKTDASKKMANKHAGFVAGFALRLRSKHLEKKLTQLGEDLMVEMFAECGLR